MRLAAALSAALTLALGSCAPQPHANVAAAPTGGRALVAAAEPQAVDAGLEILRAGGSALDAAVAVQTVLGLTEPQSSGLGGGAFLLHYEARTGKVTAYDGRETAPAAATSELFLDESGKPLSFPEALGSGRVVGAPGAVAMLGLAHQDHGRLPWPRLMEPGVRLADGGFRVMPRLAALAGAQHPSAQSADAKAYFTKADGGLIKAGDTLKNPAYAATLRAIAANGSRALLEGEIARRIADRVAQAPRPGALTVADLQAYRPLKRDPLCRPWKSYQLCSARPPASGVGLIQLMQILERTDIARRGPADPQAWYLFAEASRLAYADRDRYVGDPAFVEVPVEGMLDPAYIAKRASLIGPRAGPPPAAGTPPGAPARAADATREPAGTSHFVVVDRLGNVVSMTTTVEGLFGSGRMVGGFFLNNQLTDFSFQPRDAEGRLVANAPGPRKRPRSSMSPAIVLDGQGRFVAAVGSPGGNSIVAYNAKALTGVFSWGLSMQDAIALPNLVARGANVSASPATEFAPEVVAGLAERGVALKAGGGENSGLNGALVRDGGLQGGTDPRRDGKVGVLEAAAAR
jgi:gamma-glutamyltranspeptidase/glutathione hydrolase